MKSRKNAVGVLVVIAALGALIGACVCAPATTSPANLSIVSNGTGFFVTSQGYVVTCAHVVEDARTIGVWVGGNQYRANLEAIDPDLDIAILKIEHNPSYFYGLANFNSVHLGDKIEVLGFPLTHLLGSGIRYNEGSISALGLENNTQFQISAPVQPGNSGSPVYNQRYEVLGIVASQLNKEYGGQNVNFAVMSTYIASLMPNVRLGSGNIRSRDDAVQATVQISINDIYDGEPIFIVNNTGFNLQDIRISPSDSIDSGNNRLAENLGNGESISLKLTIPVMYGNRYNIRVTDINGNIYEQRTVTVAKDVQIIFSSTHITQTAQALTGTYAYGSSFSIEFSGNNFSARAVGNTYAGNYTITGNTFRLTGHGHTANWINGTWTIVDSTTLQDPDGDIWNRQEPPDPSVRPTGTYTYGRNASLIFNGNRYTLRVDDTSVSGTYSQSGTTFTLHDHNTTEPWVADPWTIVDSNTLRDSTGDVWRKQTPLPPISGTYYYETAFIVFSGNNNFTLSFNNRTASGNYTVAGNSLVLSDSFDSLTWTIVDSNTLRDQNGALWRKQVREISLSEWVTSTIQDGETQQFRVYLESDPYYGIQWDDNDRTYSGNLSNPADVRVGIRKEGSSSYLVPTTDIGNYTGTYSSYSNEHRIYRTGSPRYDENSWYIIEVEAAYGGGTFRLRVY